MKKMLSMLMTGIMCAGLLAGCGGGNAATTAAPESSTTAGQESAAPESAGDTEAAAQPENIKIDKLIVAFVPSREPDEIITATEPLKNMLTEELAKEGYDVAQVDITVGTNYEAVGEALSAGNLLSGTDDCRAF